MNDTVLKFKGNKIFNGDLRNEFSHYEYVLLTETDEGFSVLKIFFDGYLKNGNTEKFYGKYYAEVPLKQNLQR